MFGKNEKIKKDIHVTAEEAKKHIKRMHDEIVEKMDPEDKLMYQLLKVQGDMENIMQFGFHIGEKQFMDNMVEKLIKSTDK